MNNNIEKKSWRRPENANEQIIPISSFSTYNRPKQKKNNTHGLTYFQIKALKNSCNLPIEIIRHFHNYTDMSKITKTTPIDIIIKNKHLPWDKNMLLNKIDVRMIHTTHFDIKWNYFNLTINEPDKCNIAKYPDLPWDIKAIETLNVNNLCDDHLILLLNKYKNIKWNWKRATDILSLNTIMINSSLPWDYHIINVKLSLDYNKDIIETAVISLPSNLIDWEAITQKVSWDFISNYPNLPWDYPKKNICSCDNTCVNIISLDNLKMLKTKPLNWVQITTIFGWERIYANQHFPWDEETLIDLSPPIWFIRNVKYNWDMKKITSVKKHNWHNILENPDIKWDEKEMIIDNDNDYDDVSNLPPVELLSIYKHLKWNWNKYSKYTGWNNILEYPNLPWNWQIIIKRTDISFRFAIRFPEKEWVYDNFNNISSSEKILLKMLIVLKQYFNLSIALVIFKKI